MNTPIFSLWVLVNAGLAGFYLLWRLAGRCERATAAGSGARRWMALGKVYLVASLTAPVLCWGVEALPSKWRPVQEPVFSGGTLAENDAPGDDVHQVNLAAPGFGGVSLARRAVSVPFGLLSVWLVGAAVWLVWRGGQWRGLIRLLNEATPIRRVGRVEILVHPETVSPFATRVRGRATVVVPAFLVERGGWREAVRHELLHHRRGDPRWVLVLDLLTALFWLNPAAWAWRKRMAQLQELACDEQLLARQAVNPVIYGEVLLQVAEGLTKCPARRFGACSPLAGRRPARSFLAARLERVLNYPNLRRMNMKRWMIWNFCGVLLWAALAMAVAAGPEATTGPATPSVQLNPEMQNLVVDRLARQVERCGARRGLVVVLDPETGAVLARAAFRRDGSPPKLVPDDAAPFALHFLGASTMKTLVAAAALENKVATPADIFDTGDGVLTVGGQTHHEWKEGGLGKLNLEGILANSSNIGIILVAQRVGAENLADFLGRLGYSVARDAAVAEMSNGMYSGVSLSAFDLAHAYAILVNGGRQPETGASVVRPDVSEFIRKALVRAVEEGTGKPAQCRGVTVGGKTGTSIREDSAGRRTGTGYFVGFAPADKPRLVVSVILDDLGKESSGSRTAAPLFREIVESALPLLDQAKAKP